MEINDLISIGVIKKVIGNGGTISAIPDNSFPEYYCSLPEIFIIYPDQTVRFETIESFELKDNTYYIKFMNINSKKEAQQMIKAHLMVADDMLPPLDDDEYYLAQLVEYRVITNNEDYIGNVSDILSTSGQEILIISNEGREIMIPFCDTFIREIDHEGKKIVIDPIEGLLDAN